MRILMMGLVLVFLVFDGQAEERPWLIFEIEEGFQEEIIYRYRNQPALLEAALQNMIEALEPLTARYQVGVLIYPVGLYDRNAFGIMNPQPIDCIHPGLQRALKYFNDRVASTGVHVFLELISSGNATKQDGSIYSYPPAPLHNTPGAPGVLALALDMQTLQAIKDTYPECMVGIRFHETHYSFNAEGVQTWGYELSEEVVSTLVNLCRDNDLILVWNNSTWLQNITDDWQKNFHNYIPGAGYQAKFEAAPYRAMQDYARDQLGNRLILTIANNNYHPAVNLPLIHAKAGAPLPNWLRFNLPWSDHPLKTYPGASWGVSNQSWFWIEMMNTVGGRYYVSNENACPVEILIAFCLDALHQQAALIQFEPPWYFFENGLLENNPTGRPRNDLIRLREALLQPDRADLPPPDPLFFFDRNLQRLLENRVDNLPKTYSQNTLILQGGIEPLWVDFYQGKRNWVIGQAERIPPTLTGAGWMNATRLSLFGNSDDFLMSVEMEQTFRSLRFYESGGRYLTRDLFLLQDNAHGSYVDLSAGNFIASVFNVGDPDELVVARIQGADDPVVLQIYAMTFFRSLTNFRYNPAQTLTLPVLAKDFISVHGLRDNLKDNTGVISPLDRFLVVTLANEARQIQLRIFDVTGNQQASLLLTGTAPGETIACTTLDVNNDNREEIVLLRKRDRETYVDVYRTSSNSIEWMYSQHVQSDSQSSVSLWMCY